MVDFDISTGCDPPPGHTTDKPSQTPTSNISTSSPADRSPAPSTCMSPTSPSKDLFPPSSTVSEVTVSRQTSASAFSPSFSPLPYRKFGLKVDAPYLSPTLSGRSDWCIQLSRSPRRGSPGSRRGSLSDDLCSPDRFRHALCASPSHRPDGARTPLSSVGRFYLRPISPSLALHEDTDATMSVSAPSCRQPRASGRVPAGASSHQRSSTPLSVAASAHARQTHVSEETTAPETAPAAHDENLTVTSRMPLQGIASPQRRRGSSEKCVLPGVVKRRSSFECPDATDRPTASVSGPLLPGIFGRSSLASDKRVVLSLQLTHLERADDHNYVTDTITTPSRKKGVDGSPHLEVQTPTVISDKTGAGSGRCFCRQSRSYSPDALPAFREEQKVAWTPSSFVQSHHEGFEGTPKRETFGGKFTFVKTIGKGVQGTVFTVAHIRTGKQYACKVVTKHDQDAENLRREIWLLSVLDHPNIIRLYETFEDMDSVYLLMELTKSGDLFDLIKTRGPVAEWSSKMYARQVLSALAYCHAHGVAHMDIKPENILIEGNHVKLVDFGIAKKFRSFQKASSLTSVQPLGSAAYMAPELLSDDAFSDRDPTSLFACDCWSVGCVIYVMLTGTLPFGDQYRSSKSLKYAFLWDVMPQAQELVSRLLEVDPLSRITAQQALHSCAWFTGLLRPPSPGSTRSAHLTLPYSPNQRFFAKANSKRRATAGVPRRTTSRSRLNRLIVPRFASTSSHASGSRASGSSIPSSASQPSNKCFSQIKAQEMASWILDFLREWAKIPRVVRIVKAAMARRLEAEHTERARCGFAFLSEANGFSGGAISRTKFENALQLALRGSINDSTPVANSPRDCADEFAMHSGANRKMSFRKSRATRRRNSLPNLTFEEREHLMRRLTLENRSFVPIFVSNEEMHYLVESLDGSQNGYVEYTLFVACVLEPSIYHDECRIREAFETFDVRHEGIIKSEDFCRVMQHRSPRASSAQNKRDLDSYSEMLAPFDVNKDGGLDFEEFRAMLCGTADHMASPSST